MEAIDLQQETFNLREAATFAKLGYEAMKDLVDRGEVPAASCNQKHTVILREDLRDWLRDLAKDQAAKRREAAKKPPAPRRRGRARQFLPELPELGG